MGYTINSTKYPPRKPKLDITADSLDDVAGLTNIAEGSTLTVGEDHYEWDSVDGWVTPGSGGGGPSIYDENDLIIRMDYYYDEVAEKYVYLSITPSLAEVKNMIMTDVPIGLKRLVATQWNSEKRYYISERVICTDVRFTMPDEHLHLSAWYSSPIAPDDDRGMFEFYGFQLFEEYEEPTVTYKEYTVSITEYN